MIETILMVTDIGSIAQRILTESKDASIVGVTSRGIFLQIRERWVIFLSYEGNHGPLTLNILPVARSPIEWNTTQSVDIQPGSIVFSRSNIRIDFSQAKEWELPPHPKSVLSALERNERIRATGQAVIAGRGGIGLIPILANLLKIEFSRQAGQPEFIDRIDYRELRKNLRSPKAARVISQLQSFLGLGSGLTPSGDDLIHGFLLTYCRYQDILRPPFPLSPVSQAIVERAYQKTSLLSANLIECSTMGQADDRLIGALDGMLAGTLDPASCANLLMSWGNSSGCDALIGMVLAAYQSSETQGVNQG